MVSKEDVVLAPQAGPLWLPTRGDATEALGRCLVDERKELPDRTAFDSIVVSSVDIVKRCKPFSTEDGSRTGLVVGYVQSGKTMSMTTVASLARDSGCRVVILLAGVTEILLKQTARKRLKPYLLNQPDQRSAWRLIDTVETSDLNGYRHSLQGWITDWKRMDVPEDRKRPLFITLMKHHTHLGHLRDLFENIDMRGVPALILDDEADQAGLDTAAAKRAAGKTATPSTTYRRISEIRAVLPNHTYLQYTATPQAPLLISLADMLSPDFACVLEAGKGYTGGRAFFQEASALVRPIPEEALFNVGSAPTEPPESLVEAMREFFVGVAAGYFLKEAGHRSMLIHPSPRKNDHDAFLVFARRIKNGWQSALRLPADDPSHQGVLEEFKATYDELAKTMAALPSFEELASELPYTLADTPIWRVNSEDGNEVDWDNSYAHILVGGDKLNRGFTVEGLTVTYMPRSPGGWNADTIQQRARFFGYKAKYLGLCRIYLHPEVADAYREYVHHEEDIRGQLKSHVGRPLKEWKRSFLLDHRMTPTRTNILGEAVHKPKLEGWFRQRYPHADPRRIAANRVLADQLIALCATAGLTGHPDHSAHKQAIVPLQKVFETFCVEYQCFENDAPAWTAVAIWLAELLHAQPAASCQVINMGAGTHRRRGEDEVHPGRIGQLFEGRRPKSGRATYPGDDHFRRATTMTIQLHRLDIGKEDQTPAYADVSAIALHFPDSFKPRDLVVQRKRMPGG